MNVARRHRLLPWLLVGACTARAAHPIPIAVLELGDALDRAALHSDGLAPYAVSPPRAVPPVDRTGDALGRARAAYVGGDFDACADALSGIAVDDLLAHADRDRASRVLVLSVACALGARNVADASADAATLASYGLEAHESIAPDAEALIGQAIEAQGHAAHSTIAIDGVAGAHVMIDGRADRCIAPCRVELSAGRHAIAATADGYAPAHDIVRVPDEARVELAQAPASAQLAATQWRSRVDAGLPPGDAIGAALVARFVPDRRVAIVRAGSRLDGDLVVDGLRVAVHEAPRGDVPDLLRELAYDGGVLRRPAVWQRPWFWIAVSGAAVAIAAAIVAVTYQRPIDTSVGF
ncbi:MAG TPA: PEGA domain-containing protein [Kofleriaceae bacterium]|nr:PEGA domain-containing protein [Kofleriaceae bacterium]